MSDESEHERHHMEVHAIVAKGVDNLVQQLAETLHEITEGAAMVLLIDPHSAGGACGLAVHEQDTPVMVQRLRQAADEFEHQYLMRSN